MDENLIPPTTVFAVASSQHENQQARIKVYDLPVA
jgi:hypothetical protein